MDQYEKRLMRQELKTEQMEKVITELADTVKEIKNILSTLASIQAESHVQEKNIETMQSNVKNITSWVGEISEKANKGEQAYNWVVRGAAGIVAIVGLAVIGVVLTL